MPCAHDGNNDIQTELAKLSGPVARSPSPRLAGTTIQLYVDPTETSEQRVFMGKDAYQASKLNAKAVAVIVHEFGHVLHERLNSSLSSGV